MPVNENSYQNGKVYRIWSLDTEDIYIGSSCDTLSNRFCVHKSKYKKWKEGCASDYCSSFILFDQVGVDNCKIELIKNFPCNSKTELTQEEGKVMRENKHIIVNKNQAGRTLKEYNKEYSEEHKEEKKEYNKEYREEHKEQITQYKKEYYQEKKGEINDCECGGKYTHHNKSKHEKTQKHQNYIKFQ